jgi:hypothetical protein
LIGPTSLVTKLDEGGADASANPARIAWLASGLFGSDVPSPSSRPEPRPYAFLLDCEGDTAFWNSLLTGLDRPVVSAAAPEKPTSALTRRPTGEPKLPNCNRSACTTVPVL